MRRIGFVAFLFILVFTLPASADINSDLIWAAQEGRTAAVKALLAKGANANAKVKKGDTALMWAAFGVAKEEFFGDTALIRAASGGHTAIVQTLLAKGADVEAKGKYGDTALMEAAEGGHPEVVRLLLEKDADVNVKDKHGWTALMWAAYAGHTEVAKLLLEKDVDVNAKVKYGKTALAWAAKRGHTEIAKLLKKHGAKK